MREGIDFLKKDTENLDAFRLAQKSLLKQFNWSINSSVEILNWRPFQLAFFLINIAYLDNPEHPDRETMDLLWFPTGGGKTEAYLLIISFIIFYRRLSKKVKIKSGLTVLMRYTLRTLTIDQFKRAFSLIIACEQIRINEINNSKDEEISIGLWVGGKTTPNKPNDITDNDEITAKQIDKCPSCKNTLSTFPGSKSSEFFCENKKCELTDIRPFPFYAMDTTIYEKKPTLVIGTVDKFAQIVRNKALSNMFTSNFSPDLIIQDELHLISGPMGSLSGIYEFAIDTIFSLHKKIKIIGSTATIKRAEEQIRSLYNRNSNQFPPSIINIDNSCFAKVDKISPGRFYTGVSTAGRSAKFILQFMTSSFLQSIKDKKISNKEIDYYSSIVLYFNSLRELGGTIALVEDDVRKSLDVIAERRDEDVRYPENIQELTSRRSSKEINETLDNLRQSFKDINFVDILLATNMLSVGVDIPRLGLMLVNGYPKSMAEYIQSTSRVGRKHSGVIATLFNHNKVRDKSIYENFSYVHETLYKSVEVSSLTPFSPRSRDKSIHAPIVAIYRILYSKSASAKIFDNEAILIRNKIIKPLYERIKKIDIKECEKAREECEIFLNHWLEKSKQKKLYWWNPWYPKNSLLISAEQNATKPGYNIGGYEKSGSSNDEPPSNYSYPTPNSMRDVEPSVGFKIVEQ